MTTINVTASRWSGGWELEISPTDHTQVRHLSNARQQVIDYLDTMYDDVDHTGWTINIIPDIGELAESLTQARAATEAAAKAQEQAAAQTRATVRSLLDAGYTQADTAALMGVSRARISQLAKA
ncbi:antitoxin HicB [Trueperella bialowiezensis]|uniref:Antitoxin HicB n=1 Tax=Trueperella bialowiezensis TaxID=312285 RepID=A0A3S4VTB4_9ACTO|nr:antitoxin HicB [Trueperella bialowiezensis]VEI13261.1 Uncharacterised protein [Trueperella bialowiezensis]